MSGVEEVSLEIQLSGKARDNVGCAVECVANDGVPERLHVDANLVGATGFDANLDEGERAVRTGDALENSGVRHGRASIGAAGSHTGATDEVASDGECDGDVVFCEVPMEEGNVGFGHLATGEHLTELAVGTIVFGYEDEAAGEFVEAMNDAGTKVASNIRQLRKVKEEGVNEGAAIARVVGGAGTSVNHHASRFVDHRKVLVLMDDVEGDVLGDGVKGWRLRCAFNLDGLAAV
jgi:hypothetical protein